MNVSEFERELRHHPDKQFVTFLLSGFTNGFDIGYSGPEFSNTAFNLKSAETHLQPITENILAELQAHRIAGPFHTAPLPNFRTSPIGVVPKKESNKVRMITDLSSPKGYSINDYIPDEEAIVHYENFDRAVDIVSEQGRGTLLAKLDVKSAFRICPVAPSDWHLLGFTLCGLYFVDLCLPFGLRSSVNRFNKVADAILWIMQNNYGILNCTHYLDDYFLATAGDGASCARSIQKTKDLFHRLGIPLAPEKMVGPTTELTYLGIVIDSAAMVTRLPQDKLSNLMSLLQVWHQKKKCTKHELLSLIGKLSFAAKIIPPGRTFLRHLIDLSTSVTRPSHHISLNSSAREDIQWWLDFLPTWNGKQQILDRFTTKCPDIELFTDASGELGFGIYFKGDWISELWPAQFKSHSIAWKELFPIYVACQIWAECFVGKKLLFHCDNKAVVDIWSKQTSKCPQIAKLLRKLFFTAAKHNFTVNVSHISGTSNVLADALSRSQVHRFFQLAPGANPLPTRIPPAVWST